MKCLTYPTILVFSIFSFDSVHANGLDSDLDIGDLAVKGAYVAAMPASYLALRKINKDLNNAWKDALPEETKNHAEAKSTYDSAQRSSGAAHNRYREVNNDYVKARDGYSYQTSRTEYQWRHVPVEQVDSQGRVTGTTYKYENVPVTVYDNHHIAPDKSKARKLKPEVDRLASIANQEQIKLDSAEKIFKDKTEILEKAQRELLDGRRISGWGRAAPASSGTGMAEKIKGLQSKRIAAIAALTTAGILGAADVGSHVFADKSILDVGRGAIKRAPAVYQGSATAMPGELIPVATAE